MIRGLAVNHKYYSEDEFPFFMIFIDLNETMIESIIE